MGVERRHPVIWHERAHRPDKEEKKAKKAEKKAAKAEKKLENEKDEAAKKLGVTSDRVVVAALDFDDDDVKKSQFVAPFDASKTSLTREEWDAAIADVNSVFHHKGRETAPLDARRGVVAPLDARRGSVAVEELETNRDAF